MTFIADRVFFSEIREIRIRMEKELVKSNSFPAHDFMEIETFVTQTHLEIEKGLKWAIVRSGSSLKDRETHSIHSLIQRLGNTGDTGREILEYIREAFRSVKRFYKIDDGRQGFRHLKTLDSYFGAVGGEDVYESARYDVLESIACNNFSLEKWPSPKLQKVWKIVHIEIMRALENLGSYESWEGNLELGETVQSRVELLFRKAVNLNRYIGDADPQSFMNWAVGYGSAVELMNEAVEKDLTLSEDEHFNEVLKLAYEDLRNSDDPAVQYRLKTFLYLPKGSVKPLDGIELSEALKSINNWEYRLMVRDPSGELLGYIDHRLDNSWQMSLLGYNMFVNSWRRDDAIWSLIRRTVWPTEFIVNGESRQYYVIDRNPGYGIIYQLETGTRVSDLTENILDIFFWNEEHGLETGDHIAFRAVEPEELREPAGYAEIVVGEVAISEGHKVTLKTDGPVLTHLGLEEFLAR